jgi:hypothetical protein
VSKKILTLIVTLLTVGCQTTAPATVTPTPILCPAATPEPFWVEPVTSPTDPLTQVVQVYIGSGAVVTVTTASGTFTATGGLNPVPVEVALLPDTAHYLHVAAQVREIGADCVYGGYTLDTARDKDGRPLLIQQGAPAPVRTARTAITPDNAQQLAPLVTIDPGARTVQDLVFANLDEVVSVSYGPQVSRWRVSTGQAVESWGGEEAAALSVALDPSGDWIATGGGAWDNSVRLWDTVTGEVRLLGQHQGLVEGLAFSPAGDRLASGGRDNTVQVWDVASGERLAHFEGDVPQHNQRFADLYWVDEDVLVVAGSEAIYWWDVATGQVLDRLTRPEDAALIVDVAFDRGAERLAAVAQDDAVYFWDHAAAGWAAWSAPFGGLSQVAFSPDGRLLAAANDEGAWALWDVSTATVLARYAVPSDGAITLCFSPDGRYIALGGMVLWLWGVP